MRKTKIICTIGPATDKPEMLAALMKAGMNVARVNFSHGTYQEHAARIAMIRKVSRDLGIHIAILQDLSGPKIRIGKIASPPVRLEEGQEFVFTSRQVEGNQHQVHFPFPDLIEQVKKGMSIFVDDAQLEFKVVSKTDADIITKIVVGGELSSNKGVSIPGTKLLRPGVTDKDKADLRFGLEQGVDWVAQSFVRKPEDVDDLRAIMDEMKLYAPVIAKIERPEALIWIDEIIRSYDAVMVARGDLGIELPIDEVPSVQKSIIRKCNLAGKPVVTATQMLDSMIRNPRPTRAEATDVANAILDGTDATMLSGETAMGKYPVQAVKTMAKIASTTEKTVNYKKLLHERMRMVSTTVTEALGEASAEIASDLKVPAIITCTATGTTARLASKYRPEANIIAAASRESTARQLALSWGVTPLSVPMAENTDDLIAIAVKAALDARLVKTTDTVVVIAGVPVGTPGNTSLIRVLKVEEVCTVWKKC